MRKGRRSRPARRTRTGRRTDLGKIALGKIALLQSARHGNVLPRNELRLSE
jgi:hypothetical protein